MSTIEQIKYEGMREEGREEGRTEGREEGREEGRTEGIQALILDNLEEKIAKERILVKLQKYFDLTEEKAKQYYERFASGRVV